MSIILNIETTTKNCSVSIAEKGEILAIKELNNGNYSHAEVLHPFILDVLKGWVAVTWLSHLSGNETFEFKLALGLIAVVGHIFPIYIGFRGGKGIASLLGVIIAIHPYSALISISVFLISLLIWKFVSLSSILAAIAFPLAILFYFNEKNEVLIIFSIMVTVLVLFTHKKNIERLFNKEEAKVKILKKSIRKK